MLPVNTFKCAGLVSSLAGWGTLQGHIYKRALVNFRQRPPSTVGSDGSPTFNRDEFLSVKNGVTDGMRSAPHRGDSCMLPSLLASVSHRGPPFAIPELSVAGVSSSFGTINCKEIQQPPVRASCYSTAWFKIGFLWFPHQGRVHLGAT
jgi:hypothetical protein